MIEKQDDSFGAEVLSASTGEDSVIEDPFWTPPASQITRKTEKPSELRNCSIAECSADVVDRSCICKNVPHKCSETECASEDRDPMCICNNALDRLNRPRRCNAEECSKEHVDPQCICPGDFTRPKRCSPTECMSDFVDESCICPVLQV